MGKPPHVYEQDNLLVNLNNSWRWTGKLHLRLIDQLFQDIRTAHSKSFCNPQDGSTSSWQLSTSSQHGHKYQSFQISTMGHVSRQQIWSTTSLQYTTETTFMQYCSWIGAGFQASLPRRSCLYFCLASGLTDLLVNNAISYNDATTNLCSGTTYTSTS